MKKYFFLLLTIVLTIGCNKDETASDGIPGGLSYDKTITCQDCKTDYSVSYTNHRTLLYRDGNTIVIQWPTGMSNLWELKIGSEYYPFEANKNETYITWTCGCGKSFTVTMDDMKKK